MPVGGEGDDATAGAQPAHRAGDGAAGGPASVPQLAVAVATPGQDAAVAAQDKAGDAARSSRHDAAVGSEPADGDGARAIDVGAAVAQLAVAV